MNNGKIFTKEIEVIIDFKRSSDACHTLVV